jgi:hypothetical protein
MPTKAEPFERTFADARSTITPQLDEHEQIGLFHLERLLA